MNDINVSSITYTVCARQLREHIGFLGILSPIKPYALNELMI